MSEAPQVFRREEPVGSGEREVRAGECLHSISSETGFHWKTIWEHADNADLREARGDPMVILPRDRLKIPERTRRECTGSTDAAHRFRRKGVPAKLTLRFLEDGEPRSDTPCVVIIDGITSQETTDGEGRLRIPISPHASTGEVRVGEGEEETIYHLDLGHLDPSDTVRGVQQRLKNLGLFDGEIDGQWSPRLGSAMGTFRESEGLDAEDEPSTETLDRIKEVHGS